MELEIDDEIFTRLEHALAVGRPVWPERSDRSALQAVRHDRPIQDRALEELVDTGFRLRYDG